MDVLSTAQFHDFLRRDWAKKGVHLSGSERMGVSVAELVKHSTRRAKKRKTPYLTLWIDILDEFISWYMSLGAVLKTGLKAGKMNSFEKSVFLIVCKLVGDSLAFRHLIELGFDVSARVILRSILEYQEALIAIISQPALANEFAKTDDLDAAKRFWHSQISKGKLNRHLQAAWAEFLNDRDAAAWFAQWHNGCAVQLAAATHASLAGGMYTAVPLKASYTDEKWLGIWGDPADISVNTIYFYVIGCFGFLLLS